MDYPYINEILKQLLSDSFSIFCGSGATADLTKKKWEDIFSKKTRKFYKSKFSEDIYLLSDLEKSYYNKDNFYKEIIKNLQIKEESESKHINAIIDLNLNQIWTTNFDEIIEQTIRRKFDIEPVVLATSNDLFTQNLNGEYVVYKLNGTINTPDSMVLTKSDFFDYFKKQRLFFELLKRQLVLDSFLFIGYSFQDDLVLNALREIKEIFPHKGKIHYRFFVPQYNKKSELELKKEFYIYEQRYFEDKYNIKTIPLDSFSQIDDYLQELYKRFCNHNVLFCGSFRNISNELRLKIENIIDALIDKLFINDFNVYSGNGRGIGEIIVARAALHAKAHNNRFINRPLIFTGDDEDVKKIKNKKIEKDCNTMIIICGQDESLENSRNVKNQFDQFKYGGNKLIIPIPITEYAAKEIFESEAFRKLDCYKTMKDRFERLAACENPEEIANLIVNMILQNRKEPS